MRGKIIIEGNSVYEIDEECMAEKMRNRNGQKEDLKEDNSKKRMDERKERTP